MTPSDVIAGAGSSSASGGRLVALVGWSRDESAMWAAADRQRIVSFILASVDVKCRLSQLAISNVLKADSGLRLFHT